MARFTLGRFRKTADAVVQPWERKRLACFRTPVLLISGFLLSSIAAVAQTGYTGVFGGGPIYKNSTQTLTDLQNTGFTEVTVWSVEVSSSGNLNLNGEFPLTSAGSYVGNNTYPNFPSTLASLKHGKVKRITFSVGSSNVGDWADIESLVNSQGTGPGSILYEDFQALKQAIPSLDAIDFDQENNFDEASTIAFGVMLGNLGYHVAADVYDNSSFWSDVVSGINSQAPGTVDTVHLQTYAGGSGNNPCSSTWNFGTGIAVLPGLDDANDSAPQIQSTVAGWHSQCGILGAWDWLYDDFAGTGDAGSYAAAYNAGVKKGSGDGSYNIFGIYSDGTTFPNGGIDGDGNALSSDLLGSGVSWNGDTFGLGPAGSADVWSNTTIPIAAAPGTYGALDLLAIGVNGDQTSQTFTITYTDGTTSTVTQNLSDWGSPQNYSGESTAVTMSYRNQGNGEENSGPFYLYGYSFPINSSKTIQSLTLPMNRNVIVLGYALHAVTAANVQGKTQHATP
jgi:hypothetical protein